MTAASQVSQAPAAAGRHAGSRRAAVQARRARAAVLAAAAVPAAADLAGLAGGTCVTGPAGPAPRPHLAAGYAAAVLILLACGGQYRRRPGWDMPGQVRPVTVAAFVPLPVLAFPQPARAALVTAAASAACMAASRAVAFGALRLARSRGLLTGTAVIAGADDVAGLLAGLLRDHPEAGLAPLRAPGRDVPGRDGPGHSAALPGLRAAVVSSGARHAIICAPPDGDTTVARALRACDGLPVTIYLAGRPGAPRAAMPGAAAGHLGAVTLVRVSRPGAASRILKRAFDIAAAAVLTAAAAPVLVALAAAIMLTDGRPVIFRQLRVTGRGRSAQVLKLRTLAVHPDADTRWSVADDEVTRLGRWLRASHLDELPQLLNVLRGEMSLVGPRPERPYFTERFTRVIPGYQDRHRVPAGLTGWAQVHGLHGDSPVPDRVNLDNRYVEHWSFWLDLVILARTARAAVPARQGRR